mmetsp:Transcript_4902/g.11834  ORF Transcript_4902/g.11834 Transcript_4902/m.11834 type:complete len:280 (-) Transcript_4902:128-967(-)
MSAGPRGRARCLTAAMRTLWQALRKEPWTLLRCGQTFLCSRRASESEQAASFSSTCSNESTLASTSIFSTRCTTGPSSSSARFLLPASCRSASPHATTSPHASVAGSSSRFDAYCRFTLLVSVGGWVRGSAAASMSCRRLKGRCSQSPGNFPSSSLSVSTSVLRRKHMSWRPVFQASSSCVFSFGSSEPFFLRNFRNMVTRFTLSSRSCTVAFERHSTRNTSRTCTLALSSAGWLLMTISIRRCTNAQALPACEVRRTNAVSSCGRIHVIQSRQTSRTM